MYPGMAMPPPHGGMHRGPPQPYYGGPYPGGGGYNDEGHKYQRKNSKGNGGGGYKGKRGSYNGGRGGGGGRGYNNYSEGRQSEDGSPTNDDAEVVQAEGQEEGKPEEAGATS